jgi:hypothetical protein
MSLDSDRVAEAIGGLTASQESLIEQIRELRQETRTMTTSCQSFEEYKRQRAALPGRIDALESVASDYKSFRPEMEKVKAKTDFLFEKMMAALAAAAALIVIANILAWLFSRGILAVRL